MVQWLRLCTPNAGGPGSIPDGGRSHMLRGAVPRHPKKFLNRQKYCVSYSGPKLSFETGVMQFQFKLFLARFSEIFQLMLSKSTIFLIDFRKNHYQPILLFYTKKC